MKAAFARWQDRLFRWRVSDGTAPVILTQRRIFIVPTRLGFLFAAALVVMLLGAINYDLALGHALVFLLASLALVGMVHTFRNLVGLRLTPGRSTPVFAGETALFPITLENLRPSPRLGLELQAQGSPQLLTEVAAESAITVTLPVITARRGWLPLPRVRLATRFPLGLFVAWAYPNPALATLVYPHPLASPLPPPAASQAGQPHHGQGGQEDFAGLRAHQPADSPRHIAWKAVARSGDNSPLQVKQFAGGAQEELWLDWRLLPDGAGLEQRLSLLAGWVIAADDAQLRYGLRLPNREISPASGAAHRHRCLEALALYEA